MRDWHASLSPEEKVRRSEIQRQTMLNLIATQGHPAQGTKRTPEQIEKLIQARKDNPVEYTDEIRQRMSEAHIGIKDSEETKQKKSESVQEWWDERNEERFATGEIHCFAHGCDVSGKAKYKIIDGVRYCNMHGLRMLRNGSLEKLPPFKYTEDNPMPEEIRKKCGVANIGRVAHNRIIFSEDQVTAILSDVRSIKKIAQDFQVTEKVIARIKNGKY